MAEYKAVSSGGSVCDQFESGDWFRKICRARETGRSLDGTSRWALGNMEEYLKVIEGIEKRVRRQGLNAAAVQPLLLFHAGRCLPSRNRAPIPRAEAFRPVERLKENAALVKGVREDFGRATANLRRLVTILQNDFGRNKGLQKAEVQIGGKDPMQSAEAINLYNAADVFLKRFDFDEQILEMQDRASMSVRGGNNDMLVRLHLAVSILSDGMNKHAAVKTLLNTAMEANGIREEFTTCAVKGRINNFKRNYPHYWHALKEEARIEDMLLVTAPRIQLINPFDHKDFTLDR
jgi:hypothetical protein